MKTPLAWRNIVAAGGRSIVALCGIAFVIVLIFMQLGFRAAASSNAIAVYEALDFDVILVSPDYLFTARPGVFPRARLEQISAIEGVNSVAPVWLALGEWRNPDSRERWNVLALGVEPSQQPFSDRSLNDRVALLKVEDTALSDLLARPEQGRAVPGTRSELHDHHLNIVGQYRIGGGFVAGSTMVTSRETFMRAFTNASSDTINVGLIKINSDASPENIAEKIRAKTWPVANAFTRNQIMAAEEKYWLRVKPIGIMFTSGLIVALIAGGVILYQVLATEVQNRLREYATLKALGYGTTAVYGTVLRQALIFSGLAFIPAYFMALFLYALLRAGILLPVRMEATRVSGVACLTLLMSLAATFLAIRKLRRADPADLF